MAMTLRLTDEEQAALRERAAREGISMQDAARRAVREYVAGPAAEGGLIVEDAAVDAGDLVAVPPRFLLDSLECRGWRAAFLHGGVRV